MIVANTLLAIADSRIPHFKRAGIVRQARKDYPCFRCGATGDFQFEEVRYVQANLVGL